MTTLGQPNSNATTLWVIAVRPRSSARIVSMLLLRVCLVRDRVSVRALHLEGPVCDSGYQCLGLIFDKLRATNRHILPMGSPNVLDSILSYMPCSNPTLGAIQGIK